MKWKSKMKLSHKLYLPLIVFFIIIISAIGYSRINSTSPSSITEETPIELKEVKLSELNPKELKEYYQVYKKPYVQFLRKALDAYLANDSSGVNISMGAVKEDRREGIITGLDAFDKSYYKSKFVVVTINDSIAGGKDIQIMFQEKPDRIFYAWVYELADGTYELRGFNSKEYFDPEKMKQLNETYKQLLLDKDHAL
ncbi:hypothetical protein HY409_03130 [Candidatus Gottesmanbacteria bacterium]|nr:hypothetical protein [Candidatus Gottesmanbacteria bacterium]